MAIPRVYADTSVFGGVFDEEFCDTSRTFFEQVRERPRNQDCGRTSRDH